MTLFELSACRLTSTHNGGRATDTQVDNEVGDDEDEEDDDDDDHHHCHMKMMMMNPTKEGGN